MSSRKPKVVVPSPHPLVVNEIKLIDRVEEMQVRREAANESFGGEGGAIGNYSLQKRNGGFTLRLLV